MVLEKIQKNLNTSEKFFNNFMFSPEGQAILDAAHKKFQPSNYLLAQDYILKDISSWLLEHLSDDEMDTAQDWLDQMENDLKKMIQLSL